MNLVMGDRGMTAQQGLQVQPVPQVPPDQQVLQGQTGLMVQMVRLVPPERMALMGWMG
jgi:hypothetical protein